METDVNQATESEVAEGATDIAQVEDTTQELPGSKTESALLLESLRQEREKRRELEQQLKEREEPQVFSDEGKALQEQVNSLKSTLELKDTIEKFPALKDKSSEFNEFKKLYPGVGNDQVAKLFLSEHNLVETPARKGLEKQTGGGRVAQKSGMSQDDVEKLRTTDFRRYSQMLRDGKLDDIN